MNRFRFLIIGCIIIFYTCLVHSQQNPIEISYDKNKSGSVFIKYRKNKPGSYFFVLTFDHLQNAYSSGYRGIIEHPFGKLITLKPEDRYKGINFSYKTSSTRGIPNPQIDSTVIYALPFRPGTDVDVEVVKEFEEKRYMDKIQPKDWRVFHFKIADSDTLFASRKGVVVEVINQNNYFNDRSKDPLKIMNILVEHEDGTFANYGSQAISNTFVEVGEDVNPGKPIGLLERPKDDTPIDLYFRTYFLKLKSLKDSNEAILSDKNAEYQYFSPYFHTSNGSLKLENNKTYKVEMTDDIIFQEFSKREKRKWKKARRR